MVTFKAKNNNGTPPYKSAAKGVGFCRKAIEATLNCALRVLPLCSVLSQSCSSKHSRKQNNRLLLFPASTLLVHCNRPSSSHADKLGSSRVCS